MPVTNTHTNGNLFSINATVCNECCCCCRRQWECSPPPDRTNQEDKSHTYTQIRPTALEYILRQATFTMTNDQFGYCVLFIRQLGSILANWFILFELFMLLLLLLKGTCFKMSNTYIYIYEALSATDSSEFVPADALLSDPSLLYSTTNNDKHLLSYDHRDLPLLVTLSYPFIPFKEHFCICNYGIFKFTIVLIKTIDSTYAHHTIIMQMTLTMTNDSQSSNTIVKQWLLEHNRCCLKQVFSRIIVNSV